MGNWRRVRIKLTIPHSDVEKLREFVNRFVVRWNPYTNEIVDHIVVTAEERIEIMCCKDESFPDYKFGDEIKETTEKEQILISKETYIEYFTSEGRSVCGINNWVSSDVDIIGNIGKDAENKDIVKEWRFIAAKFPEIEGEIHVCDEYESKYCVGKVVVSQGKANWQPPTIKKLKNNEFQQGVNFMSMLMGQQY